MWLNVGRVDDWLLLAGLVVWARVAAFYVYRQRYLRLDPKPTGDRIKLRVEHVVGMILFFLLAGSVAEISLPAGEFAATETIDHLIRQLIGDTVGKTLTLAAMAILILRYHVVGDLFAAQAGSQHSMTRKRPTWPVILLLAGATYLAIYPLVNCLLADLGVVFFQEVLKIPITQIHSAFTLLDDPELTLPAALLAIASAVVVSPLAEELFFRGFLQNGLLRWLRRPAPAIALSAGAFMVVHVPMYHQFPALFALGVILGWSYYRYRTLALPIVTHVVFNSVTLLLYFLARR